MIFEYVYEYYFCYFFENELKFCLLTENTIFTLLFNFSRNSSKWAKPPNFLLTLPERTVRVGYFESSHRDLQTQKISFEKNRFKK